MQGKALSLFPGALLPSTETDGISKIVHRRLDDNFYFMERGLLVAAGLRPHSCATVCQCGQEGGGSKSGKRFHYGRMYSTAVQNASRYVNE